MHCHGIFCPGHESHAHLVEEGEDLVGRQLQRRLRVLHLRPLEPLLEQCIMLSSHTQTVMSIQQWALCKARTAEGRACPLRKKRQRQQIRFICTTITVCD